MWWRTSEWEAAGVWFTGLLTVGLLVYAATQLGESKRLRAEQTRPFVVVDLVPDFLTIMVVKNVGSTVARNVRVCFDRRIETTLSSGANWQDSGLFQDGIKTLAPGRELRFNFDSIVQRVKSGLPLRYTATVIYDGPQLRRFRRTKPLQDEFVLDVSVFVGASPPRRDVHDVVKAIEKLATEHSKWTDGSRGLLVKAIDRRRLTVIEERSYHFRKAKEAARIDGVRAYIGYFIRLWQRRRQLFADD